MISISSTFVFYHNDVEQRSFGNCESTDEILIPFADVIGSKRRKSKPKSNQRKISTLPFGFVKIFVRIVVIVIVKRFRFWIVFMMITKFNDLRQKQNIFLLSFSRWIDVTFTGPKIDAFTLCNGIGTSPTSITEIFIDKNQIFKRKTSYNLKVFLLSKIVRQCLDQY